MLIGELSKHSGFSRDTIRYYEKLGLIAIAAEGKASSGYKSYTSNEAERLNQIRCLKDSGFTLREIQQLLLNDGKHPVCRDLPEQLADKILKIDQQIALLSKFKASLVQIQAYTLPRFSILFYNPPEMTVHGVSEKGKIESE